MRDWKSVDESVLREEARQRLTSAMPPLVAPTAELLASAEEFLLSRWRDRAREFGRPAPETLEGACKFASLFVQAVFGGSIHGNSEHQVNMVPIPGGEVLVDLVRSGPPPLALDKDFWANPEHVESVASCLPRVMEWAEGFLSRLTAARVMTETVAPDPGRRDEVLRLAEAYLTVEDSEQDEEYGDGTDRMARREEIGLKLCGLIAGAGQALEQEDAGLKAGREDARAEALLREALEKIAREDTIDVCVRTKVHQGGMMDRYYEEQPGRWAKIALTALQALSKPSLPEKQEDNEGPRP